MLYYIYIIYVLYSTGIVGLCVVDWPDVRRWKRVERSVVTVQTSTRTS